MRHFADGRPAGRYYADGRKYEPRPSIYNAADPLDAAQLHDLRRQLDEARGLLREAVWLDDEERDLRLWGAEVTPERWANYKTQYADWLRRAREAAK